MMSNIHTEDRYVVHAGLAPTPDRCYVQLTDDDHNSVTLFATRDGMLATLREALAVVEALPVEVPA